MLKEANSQTDKKKKATKYIQTTDDNVEVGDEEEVGNTKEVQEVEGVIPPHDPTEVLITPTFPKGDDFAILANDSSLEDEGVAMGLFNTIILVGDEAKYKTTTILHQRGI